MNQCSDIILENKQYKSKMMAAIHKTAEDLHSAQVMPAKTLHEFDALCLTPASKLLSQPETCLETRSGTLLE